MHPVVTFGAHLLFPLSTVVLEHAAWLACVTDGPVFGNTAADRRSRSRLPKPPFLAYVFVVCWVAKLPSMALGNGGALEVCAALFRRPEIC